MLFLIHGLGVDSRMWLFQQRRLSRDYHIKAFDLPGFGKNPPPKNSGGDPMELLAGFVADEIERSGAGKANLCGYSMGGTIALLTALKNPRLVGSLALVCSSPSWGAGRGWAGPFARRPLSLVTARFLGLGMRIGLYRYIKGKEDREQLSGMLGKADKSYSARVMESLFALDLRPRLGEIEVPTMIIGGKKDILAPESHQRALAEGIRGSSLVMVEAGHYYCVEKPLDLSTRLSNFEKGFFAA